MLAAAPAFAIVIAIFGLLLPCRAAARASPQGDCPTLQQCDLICCADTEVCVDGLCTGIPPVVRRAAAAAVEIDSSATTTAAANASPTNDACAIACGSVCCAPSQVCLLENQCGEDGEGGGTIVFGPPSHSIPSTSVPSTSAPATGSSTFKSFTTGHGPVVVNTQNGTVNMSAISTSTKTDVSSVTTSTSINAHPTSTGSGSAQATATNAVTTTEGGTAPSSGASASASGSGTSSASTYTIKAGEVFFAIALMLLGLGIVLN